MLRCILLLALGVTVAGFGLDSEVQAEPAAKKEAKASKKGESSGPPDITGVWRGKILGMPGGGGPPGGGFGRGAPRGRGRGFGGGGRQMEVELTIDAQTITGREIGGAGGGRALGAGKYEINGTGTTGNLDAEGTEGREEGRTFLGIYQLNGDDLKWSVSNRRFRPKGFTVQGGNYVLILKRQKN